MPQRQNPMTNPPPPDLPPPNGPRLPNPLATLAASLQQTQSPFNPTLSQPLSPNLWPSPPFRGRVGTGLLPIALGTWLSLPTVWPILSESWTGSAPADDPPKTALKLTASMIETFSAWLAPVKAQLPASFSPLDSAAFRQALVKEALDRLEAFMAGVRAYQTHKASRQENPSVRVLWEKGTTRLLDYAPESKNPALLVVPSLVNRFEILDIDPDRSFLRFLATQGFRPLVVDWQAPGEEEKSFSLSDYMTRRLVPILDLVHAQGGACHILGYCMGGVMALALALMRQSQARTLTLMATPWDFAAAGVGGVPSAQTPLGAFFVNQAEAWGPYLEKIGYLPADFLQTVFTHFQPLQVLEKFLSFSSRASEDEKGRRFVLTEDWLNNGVPLSLPVARECLRDWFKNNLTAKLAWRVAGTLVDPRLLNVPTFLLLAGKDRIVPAASALPLASLIRGATLHEPMTGHIGLMTGDAAPQEAWIPLANWLKAQEAARR